MKIKNNQIVFAIVSFLGVYILLAGYLKITNPQDSKIVMDKIDNQVVLSPERNVSLSVFDKTYTAKIKKGQTVYDLMQNLQNEKENNFSFNYKEYPGMGIFVEEINGVRGTAGAYWIYYINGKEASVGISEYVLMSEDVITWKQE